jgi:hypothetical protein
VHGRHGAAQAEEVAHSWHLPHQWLCPHCALPCSPQRILRARVTRGASTLAAAEQEKEALAQPQAAPPPGKLTFTGTAAAKALAVASAASALATASAQLFSRAAYSPPRSPLGPYEQHRQGLALPARVVSCDPGLVDIAVCVEFLACGREVVWRLSRASYYSAMGHGPRGKRRAAWTSQVAAEHALLRSASASGGTAASWSAHLRATEAVAATLWLHRSHLHWAREAFNSRQAGMRALDSFWARVKAGRAADKTTNMDTYVAYGAAKFKSSLKGGAAAPTSSALASCRKVFGVERVVLVDEYRTTRVCSNSVCCAAIHGQGRPQHSALLSLQQALPAGASPAEHRAQARAREGHARHCCCCAHAQPSSAAGQAAAGSSAAAASSIPLCAWDVCTAAAATGGVCSNHSGHCEESSARRAGYAQRLAAATATAAAASSSSSSSSASLSSPSPPPHNPLYNPLGDDPLYDPFMASFLSDVSDTRPGHVKRHNGERHFSPNPYDPPAALPQSSTSIRQLKYCNQCKTLVDRDVDAARCILYAFCSIWLTGQRPYNLDWGRAGPTSQKHPVFRLSSNFF